MDGIATLRFAVQFPDRSPSELKKMASVAVGLQKELEAYAKTRERALATHKTIAQFVGENLVHDLKSLFELEDLIAEKARRLPGPSFELLQKRDLMRETLLNVAKILAAPKT